MTDTFDVDGVLAALARRRPVFHSEADFQFAFAWTSRELNPELEVRLETHPEPRARLDLQLESPSTGRAIAVELKYMTRAWSGRVGTEHFELKDHGAQDVRSYDVVKDIQRIERFVAARPGWSGLVLALSNDGTYWRPRTHGRQTNADAFRLTDGSRLSGDRAWGPRTGAGTSRGRTDDIALTGDYLMSWQPYSTLAHPPSSFRVLVVRVQPKADSGELGPGR